MSNTNIKQGSATEVKKIKIKLKTEPGRASNLPGLDQTGSTSTTKRKSTVADKGTRYKKSKTT